MKLYDAVGSKEETGNSAWRRSNNSEGMLGTRECRMELWGALRKEQEEQDRSQNVRESLPQKNHKLGFQQAVFIPFHSTPPPTPTSASILGVIDSLLQSEPIPEKQARMSPSDWSKKCLKAGPTS